MRATALATLSFALALGACTAPLQIPTQPMSATGIADTPIPATIVVESLQPGIDPSEIQITSLGEGSQVISPIELFALFEPDRDGTIEVNLLDATGRLRFAQTLLQDENLIHIDIPFEISRESEQARLTVTTFDEYGRVHALNSLGLTLLGAGRAAIFEPDPRPAIVIETPQATDEIAASDLKIAGLALGEPGRPLNVELITRAGKVLAFDEVYPTYAHGDDYGSFKFEFRLDLDEPTWVQIAVFQNAGTPYGMAHFKGVEVLLTP